MNKEETKHAGGRPTDYEGELTINKVREYLDSCIDTEKGNGKLDVKLPSIEGLAIYLDVSRECIYEWEKVHEEFSYILDKVRQKQAEKLLNKGLSGEYNSTIAKLILTKHGYVDKQEITGKDGKDLISQEAKEKAQEAISVYLKESPNNGTTTLNSNDTTTWQPTRS